MDFSKFDVIFGHFPLGRYDNRYPKIAFLREPVSTIASHFSFWKYDLPISNAPAIGRNPIILDIKNDKCSIIDFIIDCRMDLYFHSYFGSRPPQEFSLCGFHDQYDKFCDAVFQKHGIRIKKAQLERVTSKKHVPTNSEIEKIADYLKDSIRWYEAMRAYWA